jgi:hypothetical protein
MEASPRVPVDTVRKRELNRIDRETCGRELVVARRRSALVGTSDSALIVGLPQSLRYARQSELYHEPVRLRRSWPHC